jgi:hypothetical protein
MVISETNKVTNDVIGVEVLVVQNGELHKL